MSFTRFQGQRGGIVKLDAKFYKDGVLTDPYADETVMTVDLLLTDQTTYINGLYNGSPVAINLSGLTPDKDGTGLFSYSFQTLSGMAIGNYVDRWNNIQYTAGSTVTSGVYAFTVTYNTEDLSDWDVIPG